MVNMFHKIAAPPPGGAVPGLAALLSGMVPAMQQKRQLEQEQAAEKASQVDWSTAPPPTADYEKGYAWFIKQPDVQEASKWFAIRKQMEGEQYKADALKIRKDQMARLKEQHDFKTRQAILAGVDKRLKGNMQYQIMVSSQDPEQNKRAAELYASTVEAVEADLGVALKGKAKAPSTDITPKAKTEPTTKKADKVFKTREERMAQLMEEKGYHKAKTHGEKLKIAKEIRAMLNEEYGEKE